MAALPAPQPGPNGRPDEARPMPAARKLASVLAGCYLLIQIGLPLFVLARPGRTWRDFSWDMFSHRLSCSKFDAFGKTRRGRSGSVRLDLDFKSWAQVSRVLVPGRLETYARYLCAKLRNQERDEVELHFLAVCREDRHGPDLPIIDSKRDYCIERP